MHWMRTAQGEMVSGYRGGSRSPLGVGGTIAVHALLVGGFLLIPKEVIQTFTEKPFTTYAVEESAPPPPEPMPPETDSKKPPVDRPQPTTLADPLVVLPRTGDALDIDPGPITGSGPAADPLPETIVAPPPLPVLIPAAIDPHALTSFQPDYPAAMIRQQMEGKVTVRVTIGANGRVADIEKLSATDEAFWQATRRHALRQWRFRPATRDGLAVSSSQVLTVHFTLTDR
ncbi:energy transducer TonB [Sphingobium bisphenolivorans]|uniref:energy transducer TonB n=1 Tax=Sphingobium bisphenolivorans TaxID=1335760 RepID=UPI0003A70255|nr:energy transducer TonB [Sphingobium bisphenolivorans]